MSTSAAARRNKRVIDSGDSAEDELDALVGESGSGQEEDEDAEGEEEDAEGEEDDAEGEEDGEGEEEDAEGEDEVMASKPGPTSSRRKQAAPPSAAPSTSPPKGLKLKFKVTVPQAGPSKPVAASKPKRSAAVAQRGRYVEEDEDEEDELDMQDELDDGESGEDVAGPSKKRKAAGEAAGGKRGKRRRGSASPAGSDESFDSDDFVREYDPALQNATEDVGRMTARQRAKAGLQDNEDGGDGLLELPAEPVARGAKQRGLSEMEKQRKREENARKRKLLSDQKQEEEKTDTINRLLRAQSGRTKAKIPQNLLQPSRATSGAASATSDSANPTETVVTPAQNGLLRFVSSIKGGDFSISVSFPEGKVDTLRIARQDGAAEVVAPKKVQATCDAPGCSRERKYRCVKAFEKGGCSLEHLKVVQAGVP